MIKKRVTNTGYTHHPASYLIVVVIAAITLIHIGNYYNWDFRVNQASINCIGPAECENPFYRESLNPNASLSIPHEINGVAYTCRGEWCNQRLLTPGKYGEPIPAVKYFFWILIGAYTLAILFNHFAFNRGRKFDLGLEEYYKSQFGPYYDKIAKWLKQVEE